MKMLIVTMINTLLEEGVFELPVVTPVLSDTIRLYVIKQYITKKQGTNLGKFSQQLI